MDLFLAPSVCSRNEMTGWIGCLDGVVGHRLFAALTRTVRVRVCFCPGLARLSEFVALGNAGSDAERTSSDTDSGFSVGIAC